MNTLICVLLAGACLASVAGKRIVGGELTTVEEYPAIVAIESLSVNTETWSQSCGGSILTTRYIVSAAHCFEGVFYNPSRRRIRAGSSFRNTGGQVIGIVIDHKHPSYGSLGFDGDINVILLQSALEYNPIVTNVNIVSQGFELPNNSPVVHAGWGHTSEGGSVSEQLRHVSIYTIDRQLCMDRYVDHPLPVTENMICAGILDVGGKDACQVDSGGPMYYNDAANTRILVGIVSWGQGCANASYPGLSTRVASYTDWIVATAV
ncbi:hypothetical protein O0L34_g7037 [Tuta absoluta]|nr:hypothetical protein O0L34_g7037 [Tuta absoluta]